jgi:transcription antitermination factor NusG
MLTPVMREICGTPEWFAVYVMARHEKRVARHFEVRDIEYFLPLYTTQRRWKNGSKVTLQLPLFPSYIFVRISWDVRKKVFETPSVLSIVARGNSSIPDSYIEFIRDQLHLQKVEPYPCPPVGNRVRIKEGALAGVEGILVRRKNEARIVLTVEAIMRSVAVEVNLDEVEMAPFPVTSSSVSLRAAS